MTENAYLRVFNNSLLTKRENDIYYTYWKTARTLLRYVSFSLKNTEQQKNARLDVANGQGGTMVERTFAHLLVLVSACNH